MLQVCTSRYLRQGDNADKGCRYNVLQTSSKRSIASYAKNQSPPGTIAEQKIRVIFPQPYGFVIIYVSKDI
jgi:hypothetical protein